MVEVFENFFDVESLSRFTFRLNDHLDLGEPKKWVDMTFADKEFFKPIVDELDDVPEYVQRIEGENLKECSQCAIFSLEVRVNAVVGKTKYVLLSNMLMLSRKTVKFPPDKFYVDEYGDNWRTFRGGSVIIFKYPPVTNLKKKDYFSKLPVDIFSLIWPYLPLQDAIVLFNQNRRLRTYFISSTVKNQIMERWKTMMTKFQQPITPVPENFKMILAQMECDFGNPAKATERYTWKYKIYVDSPDWIEDIDCLYARWGMANKLSDRFFVNTAELLGGTDALSFFIAVRYDVPDVVKKLGRRVGIRDITNAIGNNMTLSSLQIIIARTQYLSDWLSPQGESHLGSIYGSKYRKPFLSPRKGSF